MESINAKTDQASLMSIRLHEDLHKLSKIDSIRDRNQLKRELMPCYIDHLRDVMLNARLAKESGDDFGFGKPNLVAAVVCVWCFDVAEYAPGQALFQFIVEMQIPRPDSFKSSIAEVVTKVLARKILKHSHGSTEFRGVVETVVNLTKNTELNDEIRADLYRAYAMMSVLQAPELALDYYKSALALNPNLGVNRAIKRLEESINSQ